MRKILMNRLAMLVPAMLGVFLLFGCASSKINWNSRIGNYTFDQAVLDFGPPERSAKLSDGRTVSEWLLYRGDYGGGRHFYSSAYGEIWSYNDVQMPDRYLRLTFSPEGKLQDWKRVMK